MLIHRIERLNGTGPFAAGAGVDSMPHLRAHTWDVVRSCGLGALYGWSDDPDSSEGSWHYSYDAHQGVGCNGTFLKGCREGYYCGTVAIIDLIYWLGHDDSLLLSLDCRGFVCSTYTVPQESVIACDYTRQCMFDPAQSDLLARQTVLNLG